MIAAWMLTASLFAAFAALAALCGEQVLRALGREARASWCVAIVASVLWPVLALVFRRDAPIAGVVRLPPIRVTQLMPAALEQSSRAWMPGVDRLLLAAWLGLSLVMLLRLAIGLRRAHRLRRAAERRDLGGVALLVSDEAGPAVIGLVRPDILYPRALLELEPALRNVIVRHEDEHRRAGDAWLAFGCSIALVLMPWNAALWWMTRRARLALEIDCDARVLRAHANRTQYGKLLLLVAQADTSVRLVPALISSRSHLERRIRAMLSTHPTHRRIRVALGSLGLVVASVAASSAQVTNPRSLVVVNPALADTLRARIASSGKAPEELRAALRAKGYPETVLDPYMSAGPYTKLSQVPAPVATRAPMPNVVAQPDTGEGPKKVANDTYFEFQVEKQVRQIPGTGQVIYPPELKAAGVKGEVLAQFVVDTTGAVIPSTYKVLMSSHGQFTDAVRAALAMLRFEPARVGGRAVKQLVQQPFTFSLDSTTPTIGTPVRPNP
ncbi:MAG: TonB family protein [Gemmatimonadetes bacterium]|nr:TonB family protein [Gemmatimonadota bacterium]